MVEDEDDHVEEEEPEYPLVVVVAISLIVSLFLGLIFGGLTK